MQVTGFDDQTNAALTEFLPDISEMYGDTIHLAARPHMDLTPEEEVHLTELSPLGVRLTSPHGSVWVDFPTPAVTADDVGTATLELAAAARLMFPETPITSLESTIAELDEQRVHRGAVVGVRLLSPRVVAVQIGPFPAFRSLGWDQSITLFTLTDDKPVPADLTLERRREMTEEEAPRGRTYTIRSVDSDGVIEIWMVLHGGGAETVGSWASSCAVGDQVAIFGPRGRFVVPDVERAYLIADESGLGAAAAVRDQLDSNVEVIVIGVVSEPADEADFPLDERTTVRWTHQPVDPAQRAAGVVAELELLGADATMFWAAGEYQLTRGIRRHLRRERNVPAERVKITSFWTDSTGTQA